jgi:hypothetical protein
MIRSIGGKPNVFGLPGGDGLRGGDGLLLFLECGLEGLELAKCHGRVKGLLGMALVGGRGRE